MKIRNAVVAVVVFLVLAISAVSVSADSCSCVRNKGGGWDIIVFDIVDS